MVTMLILTMGAAVIPAVSVAIITSFVSKGDGAKS